MKSTYIRKTHSKGHIFEISWSFATEWIRAVDMFQYRLYNELPEDEKFFNGYGFRYNVDFHCYLISLNRLRRAIQLAYKQIDDSNDKQRIGKAIKEFDKNIPSLAMYRNVGEHFDDYILQKGHNNTVESSSLRVYQVVTNNNEEQVFKWMGTEINIKQATKEAYKLYKIFVIWYNEKLKID